MTGQDPSAFQAWLIAIPSAITALSTWYMSRKTTKVGKDAQQNTQELVSSKSDETRMEITALKNRVAALEVAVSSTRDAQIMISQKHTETMQLVQGELSASRSMIQKLSTKPLAEAEKVSTTTVAQPAQPVQDNGKVIVVTDEPKKNFGKVIVKP